MTNQNTEKTKSVDPCVDHQSRLAFTMRETAKLLGVNYQTVYRLNKRGLLRSSSALRTKMFPRTEIERFLKATLPA